MRHYRIIFLLLSSLLLSSCAYHRYSRKPIRIVEINERSLKPVIPAEGAVKYKASIDFLNKHFTGLIVLKKTDAESKHLVFVTELGMRMFDFEMKGDSIKPVFVFDPLNKPKLVTALVRNFRSILLIEWFNKTASLIVKSDKETLHLWHDKFNRNDNRDLILVCENNSAEELLVFNKHKKESKTIYTNNYDNIKLKQYGLVKLYIELEKIKE